LIDKVLLIQPGSAIVYRLKTCKEIVFLAAEDLLVNEIKKHNCICYYPSCGTDLSNVDFFASGKKLWSERAEAAAPADFSEIGSDPDLFIHTDVNFYQEFEAGLDFDAAECGIHGSFEVVDYKELPALKNPNLICDNYAHSGKTFVYKLRLWGSKKVRTLIFCLCENEFMIAKILLAHNIKTDFIWSKNWNGGPTSGTWLVNVLDKLNTRKVYTDWLCVPGFRGQPRNGKVSENYPELMAPAKVKLVRNNDIHWIDEGAHGWVEEFEVIAI
jgi:hypothetical protein